MTTRPLTPEQLDEVGRLTRDYASYSRDAAGLGGVIGGALFLATRFLKVFYFTEVPFWTQAAMVFIVLAPVIWIASKEWLRRSYYQVEGAVQPRESVTDRIGFWTFTLVSTFVSVGMAYWILANATVNTNVLGRMRIGVPYEGPPGSVRASLAALVVLALPLVTGRFLRGRLEYFVGAVMVFHAARAIYGTQIYSQPPAFFLAGPFASKLYLVGLLALFEIGGLICALILLVEGWKQHQDFQRIRKQMVELRPTA